MSEMPRQPFLVALAELVSAYRPRPGLSKHRLIRIFLPTPGNVIFTLLAIIGLLWAQNAGAIQLAAPSGASSGTIAYQGRLASADGAPLTQTIGMEFRLYATATGGAPLWTEQWTGSNSVQVSDGLFNVMLGSLTPIPQNVIAANSTLFLGITVGNDGEMSPRVQLGSVPFAVQALTVPDGSITKAKLAADVSLVPPDGSVTTAKLATGAVDRHKFSERTGIEWSVPPFVYHEALAWSPTQNFVWDISSLLTQAGVPSDAELILLGWRPSRLADYSTFRLLAADNEELAVVTMGGHLDGLTWSPVGIDYGTPIPVPGGTRKIAYSASGSYQQNPGPGEPRRVLIVMGWK